MTAPCCIWWRAIGVTPAIAGVRRLSEQRQVTVAYSFRGEDKAAYLE